MKKGVSIAGDASIFFHTNPMRNVRPVVVFTTIIFKPGNK